MIDDQSWLNAAFDALSGMTDRFPNFPKQPLDPEVIRNIGKGLINLADEIEADRSSTTLLRPED